MVATLIRLRWRVTLNSLSRNVWAAIGAFLGLVNGVGLVVLALMGSLALAALSPQVVGSLTTGMGALVVLGWVLGPVLFTGIDSSLDPRALAVWLAPSKQLSRALLWAGAAGAPGVLTGVGLLAPPLAWLASGLPGAALLALVLAPACLATCVLASRIVVVASGLDSSRRGKEIAGLLGVLVIIGASLVPTLLNSVAHEAGLSLEQVVGWARLAGWTPLGWAFAAPWRLAQGEYLSSAVLAAAALALPVVLTLWWQRVAERAMAGPGAGASAAHRLASFQAAVALGESGPGQSRPPAPGREGALDPLPWQRRLAPVVPGPAAAVAARCLRYWRTDPRYLAQALAIVLIPLVLAGAVIGNIATGHLVVDVGEGPVGAGLGKAPALLLGLPVAAAMIGGWALHDDLGYDSTAQWTHLSAALSGWHDRLGRVVAACVWQLPVLLVVLFLLVPWTGRWDMVPAVVGLLLAAHGAALAWSSVTSVLLPYEVNAPGESPWKSRTSGMVLIASLLQALGVLVILALLTPVSLGLVAVALSGRWAWGWLLLAGGLAWGAALCWAGARLGGRLLERRWVDVLATVRSWPAH